MHPDFAVVATARNEWVDWSSRLWRAATTAANTDVQYCYVDPDLTSKLTSTTSTSRFVLRPLLKSEILTLQTTCRCCSKDWSSHRLVLDRVEAANDQSNYLKEFVSNSALEGTVVVILIHAHNTARSLRHTASEERSATLKSDVANDHRLRQGLHDCSLVVNSVLYIDSMCVHRCTVLSDTWIDRGATVLNCGTIQKRHSATTSGSMEIMVGPESGGGRKLILEPEATMKDVSCQLSENSPARSALAAEEYGAVIRKSPLNRIGADSLVQNCGFIDTVYLHDKSMIDGANRVERSLLFPHSCIRTASVTENVILQWNCIVERNSSVTDTLLMEQAAVGPASVVAQSILGPDVHVSAGEIHASILGPNCNAHHQSLLISVLWPTGRGNVGYGANVGSNHTGRIPDQECCAGEGTFWGLSCVVKFPVDLSSAPYSIVAAGTVVSPQRCTMPLSLFVSGAVDERGMSATNILPGWVWKHSPYTIIRSEMKFATRRKAIRHASYTGWKIIRPETIQLIVAARNSLQAVTTTRRHYDTDVALPGIGANQLSESGRLSGIQAYTECIQLFALEGLYTFLLSASTKLSLDRDGRTTLRDVLKAEFGAMIPRPVPEEPQQQGPNLARWPTFPWDADQSPETFWKLQRALILHEFPFNGDAVGAANHFSVDRALTTTWARELLLQYIKIERDFAQQVYSSKKRDDTRGMATIPEYAEAHVLVDKDPVIVSVREALETKEANVARLRSELQHKSNSKL